MARRTSAPQQKQPANLSAGDIQAAIPKLTRRLAEVRDFDPKGVSGNFDPHAEALEDKVDATLVEIFGPDTLDYDRYRGWNLYGGRLNAYGVPHPEIVEGYQRGQIKVVAKLENAISVLKEKLEDMGLTGAPGVPRSLDGVDLHPAIAAAAGDLFKNTHYADAIENACKALNVCIQSKSGEYGVDNTDLARRVFSRKKPKLAFNDLGNELDESEQEGMMHLYEGVFMAFRNPRAHRLVDDDPETAFGAITLISFLAKLVDTAKRR